MQIKINKTKPPGDILNGMLRGGAKLMVLLLSIFALQNLKAQNVNVDNSKINIGSGAYLTTDGDITLQNSSTIDNSGTVKLKGDWINDANGLINASPGSVEFNGTSSQAVSGTSVTDFNDVNLDNPSGVYLGNDETVNGALTFTNGKITTGVKTLELGAAASTSGAASGKYVYGNLKIDVTASGAKSFVIGDATTYAPVDVNISGVSASGSVTATTVAGAEPNENNPIANSSGINQSAKANRYWTLSNNGVAFTSYDAAFNFDAGEATGNPLNYVVRKFNSSWVTTTAGTVTATSTQAIGLTSFSEYEVGEANAAPSLICPADISQCDNHIVTFSNPTVVGSPAVSSVCNPVSGSTFATGTTAVNCTATNINGTGTCSFNVIITNSPTASASVDQTICYTGTATMNGSYGGGASSATWSTLGDGSFDNVNLLNAVYTPGPTDITSHTVTLVLTTNDPAGPCSTASDQMVLTVLTATPAQPSAPSGPTTACTGDVFNYTITVVPNAATYTWTSLLPTYASVAGAGTSASINFFGVLPAGNSSYPFSVVATNACGNGPARSFSIRNKVSVPTFSPGLPPVVCQNTNNVPFSVNPVSGASSYIWTITGSGASIVGANNGTSISVNFATFTSVTINVAAINACATTATRSMTVTSAPGLPGAITGQVYVCPGGIYPYSVVAIPGASTYTWTFPAGASVSGNSNSVNITFGATVPAGSQVCVAAVGGCANSSAQRCKSVANGKPNIPGNISGPTAGQCGQTNVSYFISPVLTPVPATSYTWTVNNGASISGPNNLSGIAVDFPASFSTVTLSVTANNACGSTAPRTLVVGSIPNTPISISGNAAPCSTTVVQYCAIGSTNANSYIWTIPPGASILGSATGSCIQVLWGSSGGSITCKAVNDCGISGIKVLAISVPCRESQVFNTVSGLDAQVYPNPAYEKATVKFTSSSEAKYYLNLTDVLGQSVWLQNGNATEGVNVVDINISTLAKGVYLLNIVNGGDTQQIRVVVQ